MEFTFEEITSVGTGFLFMGDTNDVEMDGVRKVINFMTGEDLPEYKLEEAFEACRDSICKQLPWVAEYREFLEVLSEEERLCKWDHFHRVWKDHRGSSFKIVPLSDWKRGDYTNMIQINMKETESKRFRRFIQEMNFNLDDHVSEEVKINILLNINFNLRKELEDLKKSARFKPIEYGLPTEDGVYLVVIKVLNFPPVFAVANFVAHLGAQETGHWKHPFDCLECEVVAYRRIEDDAAKFMESPE